MEPRRREGAGGWPVVAGPGPETRRLLVECRESRRAEAPCASVSSEATLGSKREQREPTCSCAILPHSGPRASSVLVPSGPRASSVLVPSGPLALLSRQSTSSTCELGGCLAGRAAAGSRAWRPSPHSAGSERAASVQGRPPGAPLPQLSGQLPDHTVPRGRTADISSQNR